MKFANLHTNIRELKNKYLFTNADFIRYFNESYRELLKIDEDDPDYTKQTEISVFLTEPFREHDADVHLKHLIDILHVNGHFSFKTIASYAQVEEKELMQYLKDKEAMTAQKKINCLSRLILLDRFTESIKKITNSYDSLF